jgi:hypothetical protein
MLLLNRVFSYITVASVNDNLLKILVASIICTFPKIWMLTFCTKWWFVLLVLIPCTPEFVQILNLLKFFLLLKITFNNKNVYSHRRGNHTISNQSNKLLIEALGVARIIIPALFFCVVNNVRTVRQITPQNYLIFHCKVKKVNSFYCGAHVFAQRKLKQVSNCSGFCSIDRPVTFKDYGTKRYLKITVFWGVSPYSVYKFIVLQECFAP